MDSGMAFTSHWFQCACMEFYDGISIQRQNGSGGGRQAFDAPDAKMVLIEELRQIGKTVIAASGLALRGCLLQVLAQYRSEYPHVRICLTNHTTPQGLAAVQNGLADFAVVSEGAAVPDSLVMQKVGEIQEIPICGSAFSELAQETVTLARLADYPIVSLTEGTSSHDFYSDLFLRHDLPFSPDVEVETIDQVLPAVRCNLGIGFVPREMLVAVPELTGVYPLTLDEPISPRSIYLFQRKNQPLSIAAKHLRQMLLGDRSREVKKLPTQ